MSEETCVQDKSCCKKHKCHYGGSMSGGVYGLAFIGALVYYIQNADSFNMGAVGVFKAIFWPAFLIYKVLGILGM